MSVTNFPEPSDNFTHICNAFRNRKPTIELGGYMLNFMETDWQSTEQLTRALASITAGDRKATAENLFAANFNEIRDRIASDTRLHCDDIAMILADVTGKLSGYVGDSTSWSIVQWCEAVAFPLRSFYAMKREHSSAVRAGILHIITRCVDLGVDFGTVRELENKAWLKVFVQIEGFLEEGTAKLKNRLFAMGRFQALAWRTERLRHRERFVTLGEYQEFEDGLTKPPPSSKSSDSQQIDPDPGDAGKRIAVVPTAGASLVN